MVQFGKEINVLVVHNHVKESYNVLKLLITEKENNNLFSNSDIFYVNIKPKNNKPSVDFKQYSPIRVELLDNSNEMFISIAYRIYNDNDSSIKRQTYNGLSQYMYGLLPGDSLIISEPKLDDWSNNIK